MGTNWYNCGSIGGDTWQDCVCSGSTYIKIGTIQRRLAWPLRKDDTQIREAFQIFASIFNVFCKERTPMAINLQEYVNKF